MDPSIIVACYNWWDILYFLKLRRPVSNAGTNINVIYMIYVTGRLYFYYWHLHVIVKVQRWDIFRWYIIINGCDQAVGPIIIRFRVLKI